MIFSPRPIAASLVLAGATFLIAPAFAQAPAQLVDPSTVLKENRRQLERQELQRQPSAPQGPVVIAPAPPLSAVPPHGGAKFLLKTVVFDPTAFLSKEELDAIAAPFIGRRVDLADVQTIVLNVNMLYQMRGLVTDSAALPPQNLHSGNVHIRLVEGRLGRSRSKAPSSIRQVTSKPPPDTRSGTWSMFPS